MECLRDKQVCATGQLASMPHNEFADLVAGFGAVFSPTVNKQTDILVVGSWPLQKNGRLTRKLRLATDLQKRGLDIELCTEDEFLFNLGLQNNADAANRLYNLAEISKLLRIPRDRIRHWLREGWIKPVKDEHGISFFDYQQIVGLKTLSELVQVGISTKRIRRSLMQLRKRMNVSDPLSQLSLFEENGQLLVRLRDGLAEPSGQMFLDFEGGEQTVSTPIDKANTTDEWFAAGRKHEAAKEWDQAIDAYRQALLTGGLDVSTIFNLANAHYHNGNRDAAIERYHQVVEIEPTFAKAWCNLGNALTELARFDEAISTLQKAVALDYADAHYNLAVVYEQLKLYGEACQHWRAYIAYDADSEYGKNAAEHLKRLDGSAH